MDISISQETLNAILNAGIITAIFYWRLFFLIGLFLVSKKDLETSQKNIFPL